MIEPYQFGCAVEGDGDAIAVPVLLQRLGAHFCGGRPQRYAEVSRVVSGKIRDQGEITNYLELLTRRVGRENPLLILFDGDMTADCARELNALVLDRVATEHSDLRVSVVVAVFEFEAWFLASRAALVAKGIFRADPAPGKGPESMRSPKALVAKALGRKYRETIDQVALVREMSIVEACRESRSFRKLCDDFVRLVCPEG